LKNPAYYIAIKGLKNEKDA